MRLEIYTPLALTNPNTGLTLSMLRHTSALARSALAKKPTLGFCRLIKHSTRMSTYTAPLAVPDVYMQTEDPEITKFQDHQASAPRPTAAEAARTMVTLAKFGVLSTNSQMSDSDGFPLGSVVEFAVSEAGHPVFATSTISPHTKGLAVDGRICLTVMDQAFGSLRDSRFSMQGKVRAVTEEEKPALREAYLKKYPDAFYIDFADFQWFIMDDIKGGRFNGGFGALKKVSSAEYAAAKPDPVAAFSAPVCGHMNADHVADTIAMIQHYVGLKVDDAKLTDLDRLGMNCMVTRNGASFKMRLPFVKPAEDRKGIKEAIVEMTKAAAKASKEAASA